MVRHLKYLSLEADWKYLCVDTVFEFGCRVNVVVFVDRVKVFRHVQGRVNGFVCIDVAKISACRQGESICWRPDNVGIICLDSM